MEEDSVKWRQTAGFWCAGIVVTLLLYVASIGPAFRWVESRSTALVPPNHSLNAYWPLIRIVGRKDANGNFSNERSRKALQAYIAWWAGHPVFVHDQGVIDSRYFVQ